MANRLRAVQRILAVQTKLHRLAEWKLAELGSKQDALQQRQQDLLRFLDEEGSYTALFGVSLMRRLKNVGEEKVRVAAEKQEQADRTLDESRRAGRVKRMAGDLEDAARQQEERDALRDILEQLNHRRNASLR